MREPFAAFLYKRNCTTLPRENVVNRIRRLFATALDYSMHENVPGYGLPKERFSVTSPLPKQYYLFLHGTTWPNKHYPETYWEQLARLVEKTGEPVCLLWGNDIEKQRAERIASKVSNVIVLPKMSLAEAAGVVARAKGVVGLDTGLGHLAMALNVPTVLLWGPSDAELSGAPGTDSIHLQADFACSPCVKRYCTYSGEKEVAPPCFATLPPHYVWNQLQGLVEKNEICL